MQLTLNLNQRWLGGRASYRSPAEVIKTAEYEVAEVHDDTTARAFILTHHYSGTYPAARFRIGLYRRGELVGISVFSHPCSDKVLTNVFFPVKMATEAVELGRFCLLDSVEGNGETYFLARAFDILKKYEIAGVVSFSDPMPRRNIAGELVFRGHYGGIYAAHNGVYLGRGTARTLRLLPDGRAFSERATQKLRKGERGWRYAAAQLEAFGGPPAPEDAAERLLWLKNSLQKLTVSVHHKGNHKYAWPLRRDLRLALPRSLPYPKILDMAPPPS